MAQLKAQRVFTDAPRYNVAFPVEYSILENHLIMKTERQAYFLLLLVIVLWGINWPIMKVGLQFITPLWFTSIRLLLGAAFLFALLAFQGRLAPPVRNDLPALLFVAILQFAVGFGLIHMALSTVEAGRSAILAYTTPLWVTPMAVLVLGERVTMAKGAGLVLGVIGLGVLFNPSDFDVTNGKLVAGNAMLIGSAVAMAVVIVQNRHHKFIASPLQLMPWQMLLGGLVLTLAALYVEGPPNIPMNGTILLIVAYNGPIASAFCLWAFATIMRSLPATSTAFGSLGVPVVGMLASAMALGEPLDGGKIIGLALISGGVGIMVFADLSRYRSRS